MDKYDKHIEKLRKHPQYIKEDWVCGIGLFAYATKSGRGNYTCGCLTQIRNNVSMIVKGKPSLTKRIKADTRIPKKVESIKVESLPVFAEWQRILDKELRRTRRKI